MLLTCPECQVDCTIDEQSVDTANCPSCGLLLYSRSGLQGRPAAVVKAGRELTESELEQTRQWQASLDDLLPTPEQLPKRLGQYELTRLLGQGSFAQVYLASDLELHREVALKIPRKNRFNSSGQMQRFLEEARTAAKLEHPGIVRVYAIGWLTKEVCYIAMEHCSGGTLDGWLKSERPSRTRTVEIMAEVAEAIHFAHLNQMVHRDLKPSNVMLGKDGRPRIVDFGLALLDEHQADRAGEIVGTLPYMSPEQVRGESHHLDGRTDIWSLGVMLYETLTGQRPFKGNRQQLTDQILNRAPRPLRQIDDSIPAELEAVVLSCLGKQPTDRYATARDLSDALRCQLKLKPTTSLATERQTTASHLRPHRLQWLVVSIMLLAFVGTGLWALVPPIQNTAARSELDGVKVTVTSKTDKELRLPDVTPWILAPSLVPKRKYNLFDREPQLWVWAEYPQAHYEFNNQQQEVLVDNPVFSLISLGETSATDFQLEVEFSRSTQDGTSGLFFGAHSIRGKWWHAYGVVLQRVTMDVTTEHRINIERYEFDLEEGSPTPMNRIGIMSHPVIFREGIGHRLELFSARGLLKSVRWNSQELHGLKGQPLTNDVFHTEGVFGIYNELCATRFRDARFTLLKGKTRG